MYADCALISDMFTISQQVAPKELLGRYEVVRRLCYVSFSVIYFLFFLINDAALF